MDIREARRADRPAIRDVARRSLQASYSLDRGAINAAVDEWYGESKLVELLGDERKVLLVGEVDGQVVAFADGSVTGENTGELYWIHVEPTHRGGDKGQAIFDATRERLAEKGGKYIHGRVLAENAGGNAFYERNGLTKVGQETVTIAGTAYLENVYAEVDETGTEPFETEDGTTVYIDKETQETGSVAPLYVVYTDEAGESIYGYYCSNCETLANAMDSMGRIQCDNCGNARKPTRWDSAYL